MDNKPKDPTRSILFVWMMVIIVITTAVSAVMTGILVYYRSSDMMEAADSRLLMAAEMSREIVGPDYHDQIDGPSSVSEEQFHRIVERNDDLCRRLGLQYLWSVLQVHDSKLVFTSATHSDVNDPISPCASFFETHRDPQAFVPAMGPEIKPIYSSFRNEWGAGRMILVPRKDSHGRTYIVGASIQLAEYDAIVPQALLAALVIWFAVLCVIFPVAFILLPRLTSPITGLTNAADRMASGDLDIELPPAGVRELQSLSRSFDIMRRKLKQQTEELRDSEKKYRSLIETTSDWIWEIDKKCTYTYSSPKVADLLGYKQEEIIGKTLFDLMPAEEAKRVSDIFNRFLSSRAPFGFIENLKLHKNGSHVVFETSCVPIFSGKGELLGYRGIDRDITERKQAEQALRESEEKYRTLFNGESDALALIEVETGNMLEINRAFIDLYGYSKEEVLRMKNTDFSAEPHETRKATQEKKTVVPLRWHKKKDETVFPVEITAKIFNYRGRDVYIAAIRDITERKRAEEALLASEEKFRLIAETSIDEILQLDDQGNVIYTNNAVYSLFGYTVEEAIGKHFLHFVDDKHQSFSMELVNNLVDGKPVKTELLVKHKSGNSLPVLLSAVPLFKNGKLFNITCILRDITEIKAIEEQLRQAHKMESIGTLAGGIAHDFNNILYMITGNAEMALEDIPEWNPVHANLQEIKEAGLRAAGIVKQLLNFGRKIDHELKPIGAITVIRDTLKFLRSTIPTTIEIRKHLPDAEATILADPIQINQVLMNLCTNASQAMEETGGILEITVESVILGGDEVDHYPDLSANRCLKITLSDTGPGIDAEILGRVFDPYFTTKEVGKGSGMGLAVVHGIVKNHGGAITVDSLPGEGTTFTILFPLVDEEPVMEVKQTDAIPCGDETILFVDDEESIVNTTKKMLQRLGYRVEARHNPVEALELFQSKPDAFNLVISDMTMPQMTGVKLAEKLKGVSSDIPIIICSGYSAQIDEKKAKKIGINAYVMKPIVMKDIAKTIRGVLDNNEGFVQG